MFALFKTTPGDAGTKNPRRAAKAVLVVAAAIVAPLLGAQVPAQAATPSTVRAAASCDAQAHRVTLAGYVDLGDRYPNGAYVAYRYAFWYVNPTTLKATSSVRTTSWTVAFVQPSVADHGGGFTTSGYARPLPSTQLSTWGQLRTGVQIGVWNGKAYEYTPWAYTTDYDNYFQYGQHMTGSYCAASIT